MDHVEFATKVKAKHPEYSDMSDADLTRAMMRKFPEYSDVDTSKMDIQAPLPEATDADTVEGGVVFMHPTAKSKAEEYLKTMGKRDTPYEVPKADGMNMESGLPGEYSAQYPGTTASLALAPVTSAAGVTGALGTSALSMGANALDQTSRSEPFDAQEMLASGAAGFMLPAVINAGTGIVKKAFGPITSRLAAYPKQLAEWAENNLDAKFAHEANADAVRKISKAARSASNELNQPMSEADIMADFPGATRAQMDEAMRNATAADEINARLKLDAIKQHMVSQGSHPDFDGQGMLQQIFADQLQPSDYQAAKHWEELTTPFRELPKPIEPKGINFLGKYSGDEEAVLSPRTWVNKLVDSDSRALRFVGNQVVDNQ